MHPTLTLAPLTKAFIAPHFLIIQAFMSTLNINGLTPLAVERWKHFTHSYCSQSQKGVLEFDATLIFWKPATKTKIKLCKFCLFAARCTVTPQVCFEIQNMLTGYQVEKICQNQSQDLDFLSTIYSIKHCFV